MTELYQPNGIPTIPAHLLPPDLQAFFEPALCGSCFVCHLVEVFRAVWRVLRDDGTLWINMGDSYAGSGKGPSNSVLSEASQIGPTARKARGMNNLESTPTAWIPIGSGYKPKDLMMMPARVAMALQADGWTLRSQIPWLKRNSMPESVEDRPSTAVEYVFLLSKSSSTMFWTHRDLQGSRTQPAPDYRWIHKETHKEVAIDPGSPGQWQRINLWKGRDYFWDADAVRMNRPDWGSRNRTNGTSRDNSYRANGQPTHRGLEEVPAGRNRRNSDWLFESWQGLLLDEQDDPLALVVNPAPFSDSVRTSRRVPVSLDAIDGDTKRTASPTCPIHASEDSSHSNGLSGERANASEVAPRKTDIDAHRAQPLPFDFAPIPLSLGVDSLEQNSDSLDQLYSGSATDRNSETRRTARAPVTSQPYMPSAQNDSHTQRISESPDSVGLGDRTSGNSNVVDSAIGGSDSDPWARTQPHSVGTCTCSYYREYTENASHFATFPTKMVEPMIRASTSEKGQCPECGAPWVRMVERTEPTYWEQRKQHDFDGRKVDPSPTGNHRSVSRGRPDNSGVGYSSSVTTGWRPSCAHTAAPVPQTVLDPFAGSGTVGLVADRLNRNAVLCELKPDYTEMGLNRIMGDAPMFTEIIP